MYAVSRLDLDTMVTTHLDEFPTPARAVRYVREQADLTDLGARYRIERDDEHVLSFEYDVKGQPSWGAPIPYGTTGCTIAIADHGEVVVCWNRAGQSEMRVLAAPRLWCDQCGGVDISTRSTYVVCLDCGHIVATVPA